MHNFTIFAASIIAGSAAILVLCELTRSGDIPNSMIESPVNQHTVEIVGIQRLEPFGQGNFLNEFCGRCTMITDNELNTYFTSTISYPDVAQLKGSAQLIFSGASTAMLCGTKGNSTCVPVAAINKHGLSTLPIEFE